MGINSSGNMFSLCSANYGIEKLIVMEKQGGKNQNQIIRKYIFFLPRAHMLSGM